MSRSILLAVAIWLFTGGREVAANDQEFSRKSGVSSGAEVLWAESLKLFSPGEPADERFGGSVSVSGDSMAVGASRADIGGDNTGVVYIYKRTPLGEWSPAARLTAPDPRSFEYFGKEVSLDGERLAIATSEGESAYVFERATDGQWLLASRLEASDGEEGDFFGGSISVSGNRVAVGASSAAQDGVQTGAAYLFERESDGSWIETTKLVLPDGEEADRFGVEVSLDGSRLVVGAPGLGFSPKPGFTSVFELDANGVWTEQARLVSSDGDSDSDFGGALDLKGDDLAIGAVRGGEPFLAGAAYLFRLDDEGAWQEVAKLLAPEPLQEGTFGTSVSLIGDRLAIGEAGNVELGYFAGAVHLYDKDASGGWRFEQSILPLDGEEQDQFGTAVEMAEDTVYVGSPRDDDLGSNTGAVYRFERVLVDPRLGIRGSCPGSVSITFESVTPRATTVLYGSQALDSDPLPEGPCAGTVLGLSSPRVLQQAATGFDGEGRTQLGVGESWCDKYLQLVDETTCLASDVVRVGDEFD